MALGQGFDWLTRQRKEPLASRLRPLTIDEVIGQDHILGEGRLLRRAIVSDQLSSVIFYGPPGTGKTSLARVIAEHTRAHFMSINAVLAGVAQIKECIGEAQSATATRQTRSILFVDEVHRFNKSQQDALLPHVENGTIVLIGATTENPFFEVNKALLSRSRVFELRSLDRENLMAVTIKALQDERGYGKHSISIDDDASAHLVQTCNGDARALLNAIELAVEPELKNAQDERSIHIDLGIAEESIQQRAVLYDKDGDAHYDIISAFIKSIRGSDPDAALYWMAKMIHAGEDPNFILRRMLISASEDIGLAAPSALSQVLACAQAFDRVGLPEGQFHLTQACLLLCNAPKSNSTLGYFDALRSVQKASSREDDVPQHLKDSSRDGDDLGHGKGYRYPHAFENHWVAQQYLPEGLKGKRFYHPSDQGEEAEVGEAIEKKRQATWAAFYERDESSSVFGHSIDLSEEEAWRERSLDAQGEPLGWARDTCIEAASIQAHHLCLVVGDHSGLLSMPLSRSCSQGGVQVLVKEEKNKDTLMTLAKDLPDMLKPEIQVADLESPLAWPDNLKGMLFDRVFLRNPSSELKVNELLRTLGKVLAEDGRILVTEIDYRQDQRLHDLISQGNQNLEKLEGFSKAEEAFFQQQASTGEHPGPGRWEWEGHSLSSTSKTHGLLRNTSREQLLQWFGPTSKLGAFLKEHHPQRREIWGEEMAAQLGNQSLSWKRTTVVHHLKRS